MSPFGFQLLERLHGHLGLLALAVLAHPLVFLGRPGLSRGARLSAGLALVLLILAFASGLFVYPDYRRLAKPGLIQEARGLALAFETKEHLGAMATALGAGGLLAMLLLPGEAPARRAARALVALALLGGAVTAGIGLVVAARVSAG